MYPAIHFRKVGPRKPSEVEVGQWYEVSGTNSFGETIPTQVMKVLEKPKVGTLTGRWTCKAAVWVKIEGVSGVVAYVQDDYPIGAVLADMHGAHDRHLVLLEHPGEIVLAR